MHLSYLSLFIVAAPPIVGSFIVLALAEVGRMVWVTHLLAIVLACCLALAIGRINSWGQRHIAVVAVIIFTLLGLAAPLLGDSSEPERWISVGPFRLYVAPLLLPTFIAVCSGFVGKGGKHQMLAFFAMIGAALLLALQPDASQVLGLLVGYLVVLIKCRVGVVRASLTALVLLLISIWAFSLPDPLSPVPYVEEVFTLALGHSLFAGVAVIASATALIVGLWHKAKNGPFWLSAVAAYYATLFVCSTAGITPAPLVGYGAGPILGFGLMVGVLGWLGHQHQPNHSTLPAAGAAKD